MGGIATLALATRNPEMARASRRISVLARILSPPANISRMDGKYGYNG